MRHRIKAALTRIAIRFVRRYTDEGKRIKNICPYIRGGKCLVDRPHLHNLAKECPRICNRFKEEL